METSTTESLLPRTNCTSEERKSGRKSVRIDETVDIITANSPCVLESTPLNVRETVPLAEPQSEKRRIRPKNISFNIDNDATAQNGESPCDETDALDSTAPSAPSQPGESPKFQNGLESRDNPFVPGGELAIDTDDILKRATIVRDKFILDEQEKQKSENEKSALVQDKTDGPSDKDVGKSPDTKGPGKDLPKENGKVEEEKAEEQATRPPSGGQTGDLQDAPKEKKKQKKKCCTIM